MRSSPPFERGACCHWRPAKPSACVCCSLLLKSGAYSVTFRALVGMLPLLAEHGFLRPSNSRGLASNRRRLISCCSN